MGRTLEERSDGVADATAESIRKRHIERQRKRIRQMKRRRVITISLLIIIVLLIIIFFTPLFNIRRIEITGNKRVSTAEIEEKLDGCAGKNIFRCTTGSPSKNIKNIPYVDDVKISKSVFSCKLTVVVTECVPAAFIKVGEKNAIIDKQLKVLEVVDNVENDIPEIIDVSAVDINPGKTITLQNEEALNAVKVCIPAIANEGISEGVEYISFKDLSNITFNYQDRLDVMCGDTGDFEKKIKFFNQAINSKKLTEKSRGTIDLSVSGQAVYTP